MTDHLIAAYEEDIRMRAEGLEHLPPDGYRVSVHEMSAGIIYDSAGARVTAFLVQHGSWPEAYGFRIDTPDRSIVLSAIHLLIWRVAWTRLFTRSTQKYASRPRSDRGRSLATLYAGVSFFRCRAGCACRKD